MFKKILSISLCAFLLFGIINTFTLPAGANDQSEFKPTYSLGKDKTYVSGDYVYGADYSQDYAWHPDTIVILQYKGNRRTISIPSAIDGYRVGRIGYRAFSASRNPEMAELRSIVIPSTVYSISSYAFEDCSNLTRVKLNEGLETICQFAFHGCTNLKSIDLPSTIISLATDFKNTGISEITLPEAKEEYYDRVDITYDFVSLSQTSQLKKITVKKNNCRILTICLPYSEAVFEGTVEEFGINDIGAYLGGRIKCERIIFRKGAPGDLLPYLPAAKTRIDADNGGIIYDSSGETVTLEESEGFRYIVNSRGDAVIAGYSGSETNIIIPESIDGHDVIRIADSAFKNKTAVESVTIPDSVISIESRAFCGCTALSQVNLEEGLLSIGYGAFQNCSSLSEIDFPDSLTEINEYAFAVTGLECVDIPENVTQLKTGTFSGCKSLTDVVLLDNFRVIGKKCFSGDSAIAEFDFPPSVEAIRKGAFGGTGIRNAIIDCNLKQIEDNIFKNSQLEYLYISGNNLAIRGSFAYADNLRYAETGSGVIWLLDNAFANCSSLETLKLGHDLSYLSNNTCGEITSVKNLIFNSHECITDTDITVAGLKSELNPEAYVWNYLHSPFGKSQIESVVFGDNVRFIAAGLFSNQNALTQIVIPKNVEEIKEVAFINCTSLHTVIWNARSKTVRAAAFWNCTALENFNFKNLISTDFKSFSTTNIQNSNIGDCDVELTQGITEVAEECFSGSAELESVGIGGSVNEIESKAFSDCENLETAVISDSVTEIAPDAFENCPNLTIYCTELSYAHNYASANGIRVTTLDIDPIPNQIYTGYAIKPDINVRCSDKTLEKNLDFSASYSNNINAGTATVNITGKGDFEMYSSTANFTIVTRSISGGSISAISDQNYTGYEITPSIKVRVNGRLLTEGVDYTATYYNNIAIGTATVQVKGIRNYSGVLTGTFEIRTLSLSERIAIRISEIIRSIFSVFFSALSREE